MEPDRLILLPGKVAPILLAGKAEPMPLMGNQPELQIAPIRDRKEARSSAVAAYRRFRRPPVDHLLFR